MVVECWAILLIILVMSYMYSRAGRRNFGVAILPLTFVPFAHLIGGPLSRFLSDRTLLSYPNTIQISIDVLAVVVSCLIFGAFSRTVQKKSSRMAYLFLCAGFTVVLAWVLIFNTIHPVG